MRTTDDTEARGAGEDQARIGYRRFRQALQEGKLTAGMTLTQSELCELLGVSLSPLRETLVLLEEFGLVEIKPRTGIRIVYPEVAFIRENYQFRMIIELYAIKVFASTVSREWLDNMRSRHEALRTELLASEVPEGVQAAHFALDRRMHREFVESLDNRAILEAHTRLQDNIDMARQVHQASVFRGHMIETLDEHLNVIGCLERRDIEGAAASLATHFRSSISRVFAGL
jgi:DNA-binding GntR family transcriptional regulator